LYPFTPFVDLLLNAVTILFDRIQRPGHGALYVLHCIVDAPAIALEDDFWTPLIGISEERHGSFRLEIDRDRFTWKWGGRFILLVGFAIQLITTFFLVCRRSHLVGIDDFAPDKHAFACCIGDFGVAFSSFVLHVFQVRWKTDKWFYHYEDIFPTPSILLSGLAEALWCCHNYLDSTYWIAVGAGGGVTYWLGFRGMEWVQKHENLGILFIFVGIPGYFAILGLSHYAPAVVIVTGLAGNSTKWQWNDPLSDKLWVF